MRTKKEILVEAVYYKVAAQLLQENFNEEIFINNMNYLREEIVFTNEERNFIIQQLKTLNMLNDNDRLRLIWNDLSFLKNENFLQHFAWLISFEKNNLKNN